MSKILVDNGVWWLYVQNETVGFWPPSIFNYLMKNSNIVQWGGNVFNENSKNGFPPLGSGHSPADGVFNEACCTFTIVNLLGLSSLTFFDLFLIYILLIIFYFNFRKKSGHYSNGIS